MKAEDEFIFQILSILNKYLINRKSSALDQKLNQFQNQLQVMLNDIKKMTDTLKDNTDESESENEENDLLTEEEDERFGKGLMVDITFRDLQQDVQEYISNELGYKDIEE